MTDDLDTPSTPPAPNLEVDERFPSGPWTGFFLMSHIPGKHWMELNLSFSQGTVRGDGRDLVGEFVITGRYDTGDGKVRWTKRYVGKHDVHYDGYNEGRGIWGLWHIPPMYKGGFHVWPKGMPDPTQSRLSEEADLPVSAEIDTIAWDVEEEVEAEAGELVPVPVR